MLSKLAVRRLTKLADYMAKLPPQARKHFRMSSWFDHSGADKHPIGRFITAKDLSYCGTTACALGWAATVPSFRKAGLKVEVAHTFSAHNESIARRFFGLDRNQVGEIFGALSKRTPKEWAKHCRKFLRDNS
jgi:hypothetical protein